MVLGAITMKFGTMKHKKMFSRIREKIFVIFFQVLLLFLSNLSNKNGRIL